MSSNCPVKVGLFLFLAILVCYCGAAVAHSAIDTLELVPLAPDSVYVMRVGGEIKIGWYPAHDSVSALIGSKDLSNWYVNHDMNDVAKVFFRGFYTGNIDRTVKVQKMDVSMDRVGTTPSIKISIITEDLRDTYIKEVDIGAAHYTPGDFIKVELNGQKTLDTLDLGVSIVFGEGSVDTCYGGKEAYFEVDFQDFEGFHIWRGEYEEGVTPAPVRMVIIEDLSKEDAFKGVDEDSIYFEEWQDRYDEHERKYYEWLDPVKNRVYVGFTYYYLVTTYDRGYFKGFFQHNKEDNFVCHDICGDECLIYDPEHPVPPEMEVCYCDSNPVLCKDIPECFKMITMTVDTGKEINRVYAVPNPYRTGTSEHTSPYYHNYTDRTIKFFNVSKEATLKIFTVAGDLVWETHYSCPEGTDGVISWDTRNKQGREVGSGVYIFRCENNVGEHVYGRIVIIR